MSEADGFEGLSIGEVDRLVARFVWLERRRFEVLGSWVSSAPEPEVAVLLATQSLHHAWHATLWEQHLPRRSGHRVSGEAPAGEALSAWLDAVARPSGPDATVVRLVGAFRVLSPLAVASYSAQLARATTVSDAAFSRTCGLVLADQRADGLEGERALRTLLTSEEITGEELTSEELTGEELTGEALRDQADRHQADLERRLLDAGGLTGPV